MHNPGVAKRGQAEHAIELPLQEKGDEQMMQTRMFSTEATSQIKLLVGFGLAALQEVNWRPNAYRDTCIGLCPEDEDGILAAAGDRALRLRLASALSFGAG